MGRERIAPTIHLGELMCQHSVAQAIQKLALLVLGTPGTHIDPARPRFFSTTATVWPRGQRWADGHFHETSIGTALSPNSPSCLRFNDAFDGTLTATSYHSGGAHALMGDGAVKFITESIDTGNSDSRPVSMNGTPFLPAGSASPYGVWGAMGTIANAEVIPAI